MEPRRDKRSHGGHRCSQCSCSRGCYTRHARDETRPGLQGGQPAMSDETLNQSLDVRKDLVEFCVLLLRGVPLKWSRFLNRIQIVQASFFLLSVQTGWCME